ncbi:MAG: hypothetical protein ACXV3F_14720 [Frankiaceae bacterium]
METTIARANVARLQEIRDEAAELLASLRTLQEEAKELAAALLPPRIVAGDTRDHAGVYRQSARLELASAPCDPGERAGLTRALLGLAQAEPLGAQFLEQLSRTGCVLECRTDACYRSA